MCDSIELFLPGGLNEPIDYHPPLPLYKYSPTHRLEIPPEKASVPVAVSPGGSLLDLILPFTSPFFSLFLLLRGRHSALLKPHHECFVQNKQTTHFTSCIVYVGEKECFNKPL